MGKYLNMRYTNEGYGISISLSQFNDDEKYKGYAAMCQYKYNKDKGKYILHMWLKRNDVSDLFKIDHEDIDTQYVRGDRDTIRPNICRIVEQAMLHGFFDSYIDGFEYMITCCDKGNEILEEV
ncbi:hypothetical protein H9X90_05205 [Faecalicatena contorta]|uniref:hypothetical protein n=1 Tax=Faecalicatena contorta TaxID=39482 RepID=UPI001961F798|nr:hypothetical protein [Faecalicatena contorta]MBM6685401.1 hypothetical protein [Faecalicatena contorta]MBM6710142.1 hypothetical protein [Faecalicatena contorta]